MASIKLIVDGGAMKPGPTVSQQLGPMGINLGKVMEEVNNSTSGFKGMKVPVEIEVNAITKEFTIIVSSPPVAELLKKELNINKGSGRPGDVKIGNLAIEQIISISKTKLPNMLAKDMKSAVKLVIGSCVSLGILIEGREPKIVMDEVESGKFDSEISSEKTEVSPDKIKKLEKEFAKIKAEQDKAIKAEEEAKAAEEATKKEVPSEGEKPEEEKSDIKTSEKKEEEKKEDKK
jgi:large subunit ribosomal protein L11